MSINMRKLEPADGSVTSAKLADLAVTLAKMAADSVDGSKIVNASVGLAEMAAGAIDLDSAVVIGALPASKAVPSLKTKLLIGEDSEVFSVGTVAINQKTARFAIDSTIRSLTSIVCAFEQKTSNGAAAAEVQVFLDAEVSPRLTTSSTSLTYELQTGSLNIADLISGIHLITLKTRSAGATDTAFLQLTEVHLVG